MMKRARGYNELKRLALSIFERAKSGGQSWLAPPEWAMLANFFLIRAAYSYLRTLHRWGLLVERRQGRRGRLHYALSKRGQERLEWLRRQGVGADLARR